MGDKSMAQEEETKRNCNINDVNGGDAISIANIGRSSKKQKPKKVPQRGLGVAQLEKIRLEEQQKLQNDGAVGSVDFSQQLPAATAPPPPPVSQPAKGAQAHGHHAHCLNEVSTPNYHSLACSVPLPSGDLLASANPMIGSQNLEIVDPNGGVQLGRQSIVPKMRSQEGSGADRGLVLLPNFNLPYDSRVPLPNLMQRSQAAQQHQQSLRSLAMTSMSIAGCLPSSCSMLNLHTEPPSNQSFYGNFLPDRHEKEKMVGMKRAHPFSLDNPTDQSFCYNFPRNRANESISIGKDNSNLQAPNFREGFSRSSSNMDLKPNSTKRNKMNGAFSGDFLTLAPPIPAMIGSSSNLKGSSAFIPVRDDRNFDHNRSEDQIHQAGTNLRHHQQQQQRQPFYSFLPQRNTQIEHQGSSSFGNNGEVREDVIDLTLKL